MKSGGNMVIGFKDGIKLFGMAVVSACMVFVCTFFLNFYLDALAVRESVAEELIPLCEAQLLTAKLVCCVSGGCLLLVSVVMLVFYVKLYVAGHARQLAILKALGYSGGRIAAGFWVFGLSVLIGTAAGYGFGYAAMPLVYRSMSGEGLLVIPIGFHAELLAGLVLLPSAAFAGLSVLFAYLKLRAPASALLKGNAERAAAPVARKRKPRSFLRELTFETLRSRKTLAFFVAFGCFCFSAMVQMAVPMFELSSAVMALMIFGIGIVLACTSLLLAFTTLTDTHGKAVSVMRANGYPLRVCGEAILGGYRIPAYVGFVIGTAYQWGLLKVMVNVVFAGYEQTPEFHFHVAAFFAVLAAFAALYELLNVFFTKRLAKKSVRSFMSE